MRIKFNIVPSMFDDVFFGILFAAKQFYFYPSLPTRFEISFRGSND